MNKVFKWWLNVGLKTRLISMTILILSILMSTFAFFTLFRIQSELVNTDQRFCRDFSIILANDIVHFLETNNSVELNNFIEAIYLTTSSVQYIRIFNINGDLIFSFPICDLNSQDLFNLGNQIVTIQQYESISNIENIIDIFNFKYSFIETFYPLSNHVNNLGFIQLGLISNSSILYVAKIIQGFSLLSFVAIWLIFILGLAFNFLIMIEPISQILIGLQNIIAGNFGYKVKSNFQGELGNLIFSFNEMSERLRFYEKKNIAQLVSEKAKLQALVSTIEDGAILLDTELRLLFVNKVASKVFQWFNKDIIGQVIFQYLPIHVNQALLPILNNMVRSNCLYNETLQAQEVIIDLNYESLKTFRFLLSTVLNHNAECLTSIVITIQDITRETQLNEAKNQFISNVSHELRTPLCNIGSFLETLIDYSHKLTFQQKTQFLQIAYSETQRLNILVNDVLDLSRLESEYNYLLKNIVLINTISYIVEASQIIALNKKVKIVLEIHNSIKKLLAHEISLYQVLSNLISNSLKFTHKGGRIIIRVYPLLNGYKFSEFSRINPEIARLEVIDEGVGIDKTFQAQIFDRFMRVENNIHTLKGTGLGLSIVKNIIEKHNSVIHLHSEAGIGTSFWFDLFIAY